MSTALAVLEFVVLGYFLLLNTIYLVFCFVAYVQLRKYRRRWTARDFDAIMRSPDTPGISIVAPAYNEEATLVDSVRSLLGLNYPQFEVIVVSDGYHIYRAKKLLEARNFLVFGSPRSIKEATQWRDWWLYTRQAVGYTLWMGGVPI